VHGPQSSRAPRPVNRDFSGNLPPVSLLAASGVHPRVAQSLMRHSDINLTMSRYSHVLIGQESEAVAALPDLSEPPPQAAKATGTDHATAGTV